MKGFGERETMSLSAYSSSYTSTANRREAKISEKRAEFLAPDSSCYEEDILKESSLKQNQEDLTDQTNLNSTSLRKMKNRDAAMKSRQKKKSESDRI